MNPQERNENDLDNAFTNTQRLVQRALDAIDRDVERHEDRIRDLEEFKASLGGIRDWMRGIDKRLRTIDRKQAGVDVKIGLWGGIATALAAVGVALSFLLNGRKL